MPMTVDQTDLRHRLAERFAKQGIAEEDVARYAEVVARTAIQHATLQRLRARLAVVQTAAHRADLVPIMAEVRHLDSTARVIALKDRLATLQRSYPTDATTLQLAEIMRAFGCSKENVIRGSHGQFQGCLGSGNAAFHKTDILKAVPSLKDEVARAYHLSRPDSKYASPEVKLARIASAEAKATKGAAKLTDDQRTLLQSTRQRLQDRIDTLQAQRDEHFAGSKIYGTLNKELALRTQEEQTIGAHLARANASMIQPTFATVPGNTRYASTAAYRQVFDQWVADHQNTDIGRFAGAFAKAMEVHQQSSGFAHIHDLRVTLSKELHMSPAQVDAHIIQLRQMGEAHQIPLGIHFEDDMDLTYTNKYPHLMYNGHPVDQVEWSSHPLSDDVAYNLRGNGLVRGVERGQGLTATGRSHETIAHYNPRMSEATYNKVPGTRKRSDEPDLTRNTPLFDAHHHFIGSVGNGEEQTTAPSRAEHAHAAIDHAATTPEVLAALHAYAPHLAFSGFEHTNVEGAREMAHTFVTMGEKYPVPFAELGMVATHLSDFAADYVVHNWTQTTYGEYFNPLQPHHGIDLHGKTAIVLHEDILNHVPARMESIARQVGQGFFRPTITEHPVEWLTAHEFGHVVFYAYAMADSPDAQRAFRNWVKDHPDPIDGYAKNSKGEAFSEAFASLNVRSSGAQERLDGVTQTRAILDQVAAIIAKGNGV